MPAEFSAKGGFNFKALDRGDLRLVAAWLREPHVEAWWPNPDAALREIVEGFDQRLVRMWLVAYQGTPFAYLQDYDAPGQPEPFFCDEPLGTRGVDQFIGVPEMVGRGFGSGFLRAFVEILFAAGTPRVITDPDLANARAIRAYEKAGFRRIGPIETPWGSTLLMAADAQSLPGVTRGRFLSLLEDHSA